MQQLTKDQAETLKELFTGYGEYTVKRSLKALNRIIDDNTEESFLPDGVDVSDIITLRENLDQYINWDQTPQGHAFWDNVDDELQVLIDELISADSSLEDESFNSDEFSDEPCECRLCSETPN